MYLAAYIEELGTGTTDMVKKCVKKGLKSPEFIQDADFCTIIWRQQEVREQVGEQVGEQVTIAYSTKFHKNVLLIDKIPHFGNVKVN